MYFSTLKLLSIYLLTKKLPSIIPGDMGSFTALGFFPASSNTFTKYKEYQLEGKFPNANNFTTVIDLGDFRPIKYTNDSGDICR